MGKPTMIFPSCGMAIVVWNVTMNPDSAPWSEFTILMLGSLKLADGSTSTSICPVFVPYVIATWKMPYAPNTRPSPRLPPMVVTVTSVATLAVRGEAIIGKEIETASTAPTIVLEQEDAGEVALATLNVQYRVPVGTVTNISAGNVRTTIFSTTSGNVKWNMKGDLSPFATVMGFFYRNPKLANVG
jgi:hypothetical protein